MNKSALQDIQQALNAIRGEIERVDDETKTITRTVAIPKTKIVKQPTPQQTVPKDTERTDFTPVRPQPPLPNQRN